MKYLPLAWMVSISVCFGQQLSLEQANHLSQLPLKCIKQPYPNKLGNVLTAEEDLGTPKELHPAFYGCFDWHSAVHGHWSLAQLANTFPQLRYDIVTQIQENINTENILSELAYFQRKQEYSYERTYGWNWLMKLQWELEKSQDYRMNEMAQQLQPLTQEIGQRYLRFLPKLKYPLRVGTHSNIAFGMTFAYDYAQYKGWDSLQTVIQESALRMFQKDTQCPIGWEPSGTDFLSPCMEEIDIMRRVMREEEFIPWVKNFLPQLMEEDFSWEPAQVSDRTDGHLVHLDGLNFSRAWVMYGLAHQYPTYFKHLEALADQHFQYSLPQVVDGNYEGEHWLATFALYALEAKKGN